jgi:GTP:adenosylcobinamide-phosphate guanylyltransferase
MNAVITAGGRVDADYARAAGTDVKALAGVRGETMLARIVAALREAGLKRIAVVGGEEVRRACEASVDLVIPERERGSENIMAALRAWPEYCEPLLYATSDMPYATPAAVADFVARVPEGHFAMSLCDFRAFVERFPEAPSGFGISLAGERVVNGGLFVIPAGHGERLAQLAAQFFNARKAPWQMVRLINPGAALRFAFGRLSITHLEAECSRIGGVAASAVRRCAPELSYDADTVAEYEYAVANP